MRDTNYESARVALGICMDACGAWGDYSVEMLLPADDTYECCTPEHLTSALILAGIDATLIETPRIGKVLHDAIGRGALCLCLAGLHSAERQQRWLVGFQAQDNLVCFVGGGFDEALCPPEPAHFRGLVIVVRGRQTLFQHPYQPPALD